VVDLAQQHGAVRARAFPVARFSREIIAMAALFAVYKWGRTVHVTDVQTAYQNADAIWQFERFLGLPSELAAQQAMLTAEWLTEFANVYYLAAHFPATIACLVWLYLRRPELYPPVRRALIGMTSLALLAHLVFPLAPPRMLPDLGFVDTGALYGPNVYPKAPGEDTLVNQYAAMPSLHVGWAVLVAAALIAATRSRWRWLWLVHPTITTMAVVTTANHYWIDGIAACVLLAAMTILLERLHWLRLARFVPERFRPKPLPGQLGPSGMFETVVEQPAAAGAQAQGRPQAEGAELRG
jgi:hypothetical protein